MRELTTTQTTVSESVADAAPWHADQTYAPGERRILDVLATPEGRDLPPDEVARRAGVTVRQYWIALRQPRVVRGLALIDSADVYESVRSQARAGSFQHSRLLLEIAQLVASRPAAIALAQAGSQPVAAPEEYSDPAALEQKLEALLEWSRERRERDKEASGNE